MLESWWSVDLKSGLPIVIHALILVFLGFLNGKHIKQVYLDGHLVVVGIWPVASYFFFHRRYLNVEADNFIWF